MTTPHLDSLSLGNPWAHDLDTEAVEWNAQRDRARLAMDAAAVELADELAERVTADAAAGLTGRRLDPATHRRRPLVA